MYSHNSKRTSHYSLSEVKTLVEHNSVLPTQTAIKGSHALGLSTTEMYDVILGLQNKDFSVSKVDERNHELWQDAYKKEINGVEVYIKFQVKEIAGKKLLLLSFKENVRF